MLYRRTIAVAIVVGLLTAGCSDILPWELPWEDEGSSSSQNSPDPEMNVDVLLLDFGDVLVGSSSALRVQITNTGSTELVVTSITLGAPTSGDFTITSGPQAITVAVAANVTVQVTYTPTDLGSDSGTLRIESDDPQAPARDLSILGRGVAQPVADIDVRPTSLDFSQVSIGSSRSLDVTVQNTGSATLQLSRIAFETGTGPDFSLVGELPSGGVAPGASIVFQVVYAPSSPGPQSGQLRIESDDSDEGVIIMALTANGVAVPVADIDVSPLSLDFGDVLLGSSRSLGFTVRNNGTAMLTISSIRLDAGTSTEFAFTSGTAVGAVGPGDSFTVGVMYTPVDQVPDSRTVRLESDDADEGIVIVSLSGGGVPAPLPEIDVFPLSLLFGDVVLGDSMSHVFTVRNTGTATLAVSSIRVDPATTGEFAITSGPPSASILPGGSVTVGVTYTPADWNLDSGALVVESDDADEGIVTVSLSGGGVPAPLPEIDVSPLSLLFGDVVLGSSRSLSLLVRNNGTGPLAVSIIRLDPATTGEFAITSGPTSASILPGASVTVGVTYTPVDENPDSGTLLVESDDADEPVVSVFLSGNGVPGGSTTLPVTLAWDAPTLNADSTPLNDLAGFRIYEGMAPGQYTTVTDVGGLTQFTVSLPPGTYYFSVTAYDSSGNESAFAQEIEVILAP